MIFIMNKEKIVSLSLVGAIGLGSCVPAMAVKTNGKPAAKRDCFGSSVGSSQSSRLIAMEADEDEDNDMEVLKRYTLEQAKIDCKNAQKPIEEKEDKVEVALSATFGRVSDIIRAENTEIEENAKKKRKAAKEELKKTREDWEATAAVLYQEHIQADEHLAELEEKAGEHPTKEDIAEIEKARKIFEKLEEIVKKTNKKMYKEIAIAKQVLEYKFAAIGKIEKEQIDAMGKVEAKIDKIETILYKKLVEVLVNEREMLGVALKKVEKAFKEGVDSKERAKVINEFIALVDRTNKMYSEAPHTSGSSFSSSQSSRLTAMEADEDEDSDIEVVERYTPGQAAKDYDKARWQINTASAELGEKLSKGIIGKLRDAADAKIEKIRKEEKEDRKAAEEEFEKTREGLEEKEKEVYQKYEEASQHLAELEEKAGEHPTKKDIAEIKAARKELERLEAERVEISKRTYEEIGKENEKLNDKLEKIGKAADERVEAIEKEKGKIEEVEKILEASFRRMIANKREMLDVAYKEVEKAFTEGMGPEEREEAINQFIVLVDAIDEIHQNAEHIIQTLSDLIEDYATYRIAPETRGVFCEAVVNFGNELGRYPAVCCLLKEIFDEQFENLKEKCVMYEKARAAEVACIAFEEASKKATEAYEKAKAVAEVAEARAIEAAEIAIAYTIAANEKGVNIDMLKGLQTEIINIFKSIAETYHM